MSKTLSRRKEVLEVEDLGDEYIVHLRPPYGMDIHRNGQAEQHIFGADTVRQALSIITKRVGICNCPECLALVAETN